MKKKNTVWLIVAVSLASLGLILFVSAMSVYHWDFSKLNTASYEAKTYRINEEFDSISLNTDTADILIAASDDGLCRVVCDEKEHLTYSVTVRDDTLYVRTVDERAWYEHISLGFGKNSVTVYLPDTVLQTLTVKESTGDIELSGISASERIELSLSTGDVRISSSISPSVSIKTSTGDIRAEKIQADNISIGVSTGSVCLMDITCKELVSDGSTGDIRLVNVYASDSISIERSTGDLTLEDSDSADLYLKTSTGDIKGSLLSDKIFDAKTSTGSVDLPSTSTGGKCKIRSSTGDIRIKITE